MRVRSVLAALVALPFLTTGCALGLVAAGTAVGAGALVWQSGWLRGNIDEPIERVERASKAALADFRIKVENSDLKPTYGTVDATDPDGRRVVVELRALGDKQTQVRIRAGFWGDEALSLRIFEQMKKHL